MKYILFVAFTFFPVCLLMGQQRLTGSVIDSASKQALKNVIVQNHTLNTKTFSDDGGNFSLAAQAGHTVSFSRVAHRSQTVVVRTLDPLIIRLVPNVNILEEVEVRHLKTFPSSWQSPAFRGQSMVYRNEYDDPTAGGVVFRIWYWKKDEKRRKNRLKAEKMLSADRHIREIFSPLNLSLYIPLKGSDLDSFIWHYTPTPEIFSSPNFELLLYLNESYKKYQRLTAAEKKVPVLQLK